MNLIQKKKNQNEIRSISPKSNIQMNSFNINSCVYQNISERHGIWTNILNFGNKTWLNKAFECDMFKM